MPRVARKIVDGGIYHLINRGNGQQQVFHKEGDFQAFTALLVELSARYAVDVFAWCLMSNHYHLIVRANTASDLSRGMHWFQTTHVRRYHKHYGSSGHLWQGRYKSFAIENDEQLLTVIRYIEANPVRAKMVDSAVKWPWSSHRYRPGTAGTGSAGAFSEGACPVDNDNHSNILAPLPIALPQPWTAYVDAPMTATELSKMRVVAT